MNARLQSIADLVTRLVATNAVMPDGQTIVANLQVAVGQAIADNVEPPAIAPADQVLAEIAAGVKAIRDAAGV